MGDPLADDEKRLDPAAERVVAKVRRLMAIASLTTFVGVAAVLVAIGYRVFKSEGRPAADVTTLLPKGARIVTTAVSADHLVVTLDVAGATEVRTFDLATLRPVGRLRFATEP